MPDFQFNGIHLMIVFTVAILAFLAGAYFGWLLKEEEQEGVE